MITFPWKLYTSYCNLGYGSHAHVFFVYLYDDSQLHLCYGGGLSDGGGLSGGGVLSAVWPHVATNSVLRGRQIFSLVLHFCMEFLLPPYQHHSIFE